MANKYFTQLTNLAAGSIAGGDAYAIEDISAGETKYVTDTDLVAHLSNAIGSDGWIADTDTWQYVSSNTYKVAGKDVTSKFEKGTKLKFTQTSVKYAYSVGAVYGTDSTITIAAGSDYTLASAAITSPYYSYASNPNSFPAAFNWSATHPAGFSGGATVVARFYIQGKICTVEYSMVTLGTGNANSYSITLPVTAAVVSSGNWYGAVGYVYDNNTAQAAGMVQVTTGGTVANVYKSAQAAWTSAAGKGAAFILPYEI